MLETPRAEIVYGAQEGSVLTIRAQKRVTGSALHNRSQSDISIKARSCLNSKGHHGDRQFGIGRGKMNDRIQFVEHRHKF